MVELLTPEEEALLTPEEAEVYKGMLELQLARRSPLDLAEMLFPETRRWKHLELLNDYLVALAEYRLTAVGPVEAEQVQWWYIPEGGAEEGTMPGERIHVLRPQDIPEIVDASGAYDIETGNQIVFKLAVSMRPRAGKSRLITEVLPFWMQIQEGGDIQIGVGTYSDDFAADWGGMARDKAIEFHADHPWFPLPAGGGKAPRAVFSVEGSEGKIRYTGVGGGITGKTLHVKIGDDFLKNDDAAQSEATRDASHRFYDRTWDTRNTRDLRPDARFPIPLEVLMGTRWHQSDVTGHACYDPETREPKPEWCILNIPALSEGEGDPLGRPEGQAHPNAAGESRADLEIKRRNDPRGFAALYQGRPTPEGGGLIKTDFPLFWYKGEGEDLSFMFREQDPEDPAGVPLLSSVSSSECVRFTAVDVAATKSSAADYTVAYACAFHRATGNLFVLDRYKGRIHTDEYIETLIPFAEDNEAYRIIVENITYGQTFQQQIRRLKRDGGNRKLSIEETPKAADKVARVISSGLPSLTRERKILIPKEASFSGDMIAELGIFPYGDHDDDPDAMAFAAWYVNEMPAYSPPKEKKKYTLADEIDAHVEEQHKKIKRGRGNGIRWSAPRRR